MAVLPSNRPQSASTDVVAEAHILVARFLQSQGYNDTLDAFKREAVSYYPDLEHELVSSDKAKGNDLKDVVESYLAQRLSKLEIPEAAPLEAELDALQVPSSLPTRVVKTVRESHNVLTVKKGVLPQRTFNTASGRFESEFHPALFTTSVDRTLKAYAYPSFALLSTISFPSPVLTISISPKHSRYLVAGTMDGMLYLVDLVTRDIKQQLKQHTKYIVRTAWSPDGTWCATAGYDRQIQIYQVIESPSSEPEETLLEGEVPDELYRSPQLELVLRKTLSTKTNPEGLVWLPMTRPCELVYSCRDDYLLRYLKMPDNGPEGEFTPASYNLNENGDACLYMTIHPTLPIIALQTSTENARVLLYPFHSSTRLRTIYTQASQSEFFSPRHSWLPDGTALAVTSEDGIVRIVDIDGKIRSRIGSHGIAAPSDDGDEGAPQERRERVMAMREQERGSSVVKDVEVLQGEDRLQIVSVGFDKSVRVSE